VDVERRAARSARGWGRRFRIYRCRRGRRAAGGDGALAAGVVRPRGAEGGEAAGAGVFGEEVIALHICVGPAGS
jgi:hypothetical protein